MIVHKQLGLTYPDVITSLGFLFFIFAIALINCTPLVSNRIPLDASYVYNKYNGSLKGLFLYSLAIHYSDFIFFTSLLFFLFFFLSLLFLPRFLLFHIFY